MNEEHMTEEILEERYKEAYQIMLEAKKDQSNTSNTFFSMLDTVAKRGWGFNEITAETEATVKKKTAMKTAMKKMKKSKDESKGWATGPFKLMKKDNSTQEDWSSAKLDRMLLYKNQLVHIEGAPFRLEEDTVMLGVKENLNLTKRFGELHCEVLE